LNHEGDLFRTRLTHSLEVAQLGRALARSLRLNEDLVETIALAHDLGHTPFGHAGQDALNQCMKKFGGFEHNLQSLRVVDELEERYALFNGLNLCFETREGILKRCSVTSARQLCAREPEGPALRFLNHQAASLEAQLCNLADEIAYNAHDLDDGVRSGLLQISALQDVALIGSHLKQVQQQHPALQGRRLLYEAIRLMLSNQVYDVIDHCRQVLQQFDWQTGQQAQEHGVAVIGFSKHMQRQSKALKKFLFDHLYRHPNVVEPMQAAQIVVQDLFTAYVSEPSLMQEGFQEQAERPDTGASPLFEGVPRVVADYIAGMTDRFAIAEHYRLTGRRMF
jgi:dGTPase